MRIGIDFGTSYTAAAAYINGSIQHILFRGESQFRTAVFVPEKPVDMSQFDESLYVQEVANSILSSKSSYTQKLKKYEEAASQIRVDYRRQVRDGYLSEEEAIAKIGQAIFALNKPTLRSDDDLRKSAYGEIRRRWVQAQISAGREQTTSIDDSAVFGEEAIEEFFAYEAGRLIQSPKSMLGFKLGEPQRVAIVQIVANVLRHIRLAASEQLGADVTEATIGRPVTFRSSMGEAGSKQAISLLREAASQAGFTSVDFLAEPAAAAITYHANSSVKRRTVIVDVGGGTTDIAFGEVGGSSKEPKIETTWGIGKGGSDVDVGLSLKAVMPAFGKGNCSLLAPVYVNAAMVSDLNRQKDFRQNPLVGVQEPFLSRVRSLQRNGVTVRLNRDVEALKVALSTHTQAATTLDYIEADLSVTATRSDLEYGRESFVRSFDQLLHQVKESTAESSPVLFLTGGMSRAPYIAETVRKHFPGSEIVHGDASLGVVGGLAIHAAMKHSSRPTED
ncbi:TPA: Hsp70 family protein [Pseudomonas aeruginosa]|uniref:Hsp70 family protein n=1 Tax=Pseudomonas aeruginosa TaxID=287 RepID=UPI0005BA7897|nr:Hsp70 family protein [Pseudomonas aeruginosa]MBI7363642.1 Hsp70 family protein [Pseudomonas aeruginosa]MBX6863079.1 Hsp70 family protein [Pseudomonas aeruginosa]MCZ9751528.1 Hsp70 family protein [Pseudomonas aeruginosa]NPS70499.1 Hsp70 family protein [Pseudomonas aeruginosa]PQM13758.1 heat-shock protein Hsp70 [Pseudomonas aeruginosa]